ncbi:MAG: ATPase, T2SS/T4P/T4SS family, partial [Candidatus Hydrogenedentes bacterium]|nr:ATPase, T2SS/T4P/T4SS family [Candidatus Hydrogenedentota bacterium]
ITQMQVQPRIGFDFALGLRSMLRHDPDIMMVGEIRDFETAEMAIRSSLTGHLVFSTLHTNDAAGAVTRLVDMGVEPFLIASTMIASVAQRLVRCVCVQCAEPYQPDASVLREFGVTLKGLENATFRRGRGCDACRHTGYRGRIAIYEILTFSGSVKEMTYHRSPASEIKRKGREQGMRTLRESGWQQVCRGRSTLEEVMRVTSDADVLDAIEPGDASVQV